MKDLPKQVAQGVAYYLPSVCLVVGGVLAAAGHGFIIEVAARTLTPAVLLAWAGVWWFSRRR